jgi:hypothetical protein
MNPTKSLLPALPYKIKFALKTFLEKIYDDVTFRALKCNIKKFSVEFSGPSGIRA